MKALEFVVRGFFILLVLFSTCVLARTFKIPRLSPLQRKLPRTSVRLSVSSASEDDFKTYFYEQTLDHFNYGPGSYATFKQKYVINSKYWGGADSSSPILAYLGAEEAQNRDYIYFGLLRENAPQLKALLVYIEHRFYGDSVPFGSIEEAMKNSTTRGYFNSAQAIADYAEVLLHVKEKFSCPKSPIIVIGGSYGGLLAAWLRLKYPHVALGALASSSPVLYFDQITPQNAFFSVINKDYKEASESCYQTIRKSWSEVDRVASQPNGLSILSKRFRTCSHLNNTSELKNDLQTRYVSIAQYNQPPEYPLQKMCNAIDGAPKGSDILERIVAGVFAFYSRNSSCYEISEEEPSSLKLKGWEWQVCSEIVLPIGITDDDSIFPYQPFNLTDYVNQCKIIFGVPARPHWITTNYGGNDVKVVLKKFASNIIFSNGLRDPWSSGGILEDLSDSLLAIYTRNGSHCLDILSSMKDDPEWLVRQRKIEVEIMQGWIAQYQADLHATEDRKKLN